MPTRIPSPRSLHSLRLSKVAPARRPNAKTKGGRLASESKPVTDAVFMRAMAKTAFGYEDVSNTIDAMMTNYMDGPQSVMDAVAEDLEDEGYDGYGYDSEKAWRSNRQVRQATKNAIARAVVAALKANGARF